jgi:hypothetical protein
MELRLAKGNGLSLSLLSFFRCAVLSLMLMTDDSYMLVFCII